MKFCHFLLKFDYLKKKMNLWTSNDYKITKNDKISKQTQESKSLKETWKFEATSVTIEWIQQQVMVV